ncbi:MAG: 2'-5' RNA ligase family protein [Gammaproteobacteria bacterium]
MSQSSAMIQKNKFIALLPSEERQNSIFTILKIYKKQIEGLTTTKWVYSTDYHITIGYMKSVDEHDVTSLLNAMTSSLPKVSSFKVTVSGVSFLGRSLTLLLEPNDTFQSIYQTLLQQVQMTTQDKYPFETKGHFLPHLTLGKIDRNNAPHLETRELISKMLSERYHHFSFDTESLCLMQSKNVEAGGKSRYETLQKYRLNPAQRAGP